MNPPPDKRPPGIFGRLFIGTGRAQLLIFLLTGYLAGYICLRFSKTFVRIENKGGEQRNRVLAPSDPWDELAREMSKETPVAMIWRARKPVLNAVYLPLRKMESVYWNCTAK
jgi:hypothetical protein